VDTPQESQPARIVPFPQDRVPAPPTKETKPPADDVVTGQGPADLTVASAGETIDRLLAVSDVEQRAENPDIHHLRAVRLGVSSGAFYPHVATEDVPRAAAALGLTDLEIMLQTVGEYDPAFIRRLARASAVAGTTICSVHSMHRLHPFGNAYPRRAREGRDLFQRGIEATAALGATTLVWHGFRREEMTGPDAWDRFIAQTAELALACGEAGITLGLENVSWCALATVRDVVTFATRLAEIGSPEQIGFVFDPFQAAEAKANPFMMLAAMGNRVVDVHISDYRDNVGNETFGRHLPPGDGDLPWSALLRAVAGSGYAGPLMIEGPLGTDDTVIGRIRDRFNPLIRNVFPFAPDAPAPSEGKKDPVSLPEGVRHGIELFNQRRFFEAHEEIEAEWHAERGQIRRLYQGILQIGVGYYHALNGNHRGAVLLLTDGIEKTSDFAPRALGIELEPLLAAARAALAQIVALGPDRLGEFDEELIPTIELSSQPA
jgi:sugar phosphate isomerase/epimerase/predicted metal-dependent hydrolase